MKDSYSIYPSQLLSFKAKSSKLMNVLEEFTPFGGMSFFRWNDLISRSLGYKGHSDLVYHAKFRASSDSGEPLILFSDISLVSSIATQLSNASELLTYDEVVDACLSISEDQNLRGLIEKSNDNFASLLVNLMPEEKGIASVQISSRLLLRSVVSDLESKGKVLSLAHLVESLNSNNVLRIAYGDDIDPDAKKYMLHYLFSITELESLPSVDELPTSWLASHDVISEQVDSSMSTLLTISGK